MFLSTHHLEDGRHDSTVVVVVVRTRPRAIPLTVITTRKSIHGFPLVSYMSMGLRLAALRAAGAPLGKSLSTDRSYRHDRERFNEKYGPS